MKRDYKDCYGTDVKKTSYKRPRYRFTTWIQNSFEPEGFVGFCICIFFGLVLFYILYTS